MDRDTIRDEVERLDELAREMAERARALLDDITDAPTPLAGVPENDRPDFAWDLCEDIPWKDGIIVATNTRGDCYVLEAQRERCAHGGHWDYELILDHPDSPVKRVECNETIRWRRDTGPDSMQAARDAAERLRLEPGLPGIEGVAS